jgi:hypothetical protein
MSRREWNDEELVRHRRGVVVLLWITPLAWIVSLVLTAIGHIASEVGYDSGAGFALLATATFGVPAVWLLVRSLRLGAQTSENVGLRITSASVAALVLVVGCLVSLPPLVSEVRSSISIAVRKAQPPTEAEEKYSPAELETISVQAFEDAFAALTDVVPTGVDLVFADGRCKTSNLDEGWTYGGEAWVDVAALDPEFVSHTTDRWKDLGYTPHPEPDVAPWPDPLVAVQSDHVEQLTLIQANDRVLMTFDAICVPGTNPDPNEPYRHEPGSEYWAERGPFAEG